MTITFLSPTIILLASLVNTLNSSQAFQIKKMQGMASKHAMFALSPSIAIHEEKIQLKSGVAAQVLSSIPSNPTQPPLAFVHGSFHAAWCWSECYFPYFVGLGYPVAALSLRGTGGTFAGKGVKKVKIEDHAKDLQSFLEQLPKVLNGNQAKPILISHSFGGLVVMKHLELHPSDAANISGIITLCSVPPSGNGKMTLRYLRRSLVDSWKITAGFAMKKCIKNDELCRDLFFGGHVGNGGGNFGISNDDIHRYQSYFERDTEATIDIMDLMKRLPSKEAVGGKAPHLDQFPPCLVVGATRDFIVDDVGVEETATYFGLESPTMIDSPHDVMLGQNWENGAGAIHRFIQGFVVTS